MKTVIVYFSPTNGTEKAAIMLGAHFSEQAETINLTKKENREKTYSFDSDTLVIAAAPVYAGQLPQAEGLFENLKGSNTPCVVMAAYGNRHYDDTLAQLSKRLAERGFITIGGIACIIPHIFSNILGAGRPDSQDDLRFAEFAEKIKQKLENGSVKAVELPGNPDVAPKPVSAPKTYDSQKCVKCYACVKNCPVGAIDRETMQSDPAVCISCMRCVKVCPKQAWEFNTAPLTKRLEDNFSAPRSVECFTDNQS